jgi:hypothetical protein
MANSSARKRKWIDLGRFTENTVHLFFGLLFLSFLSLNDMELQYEWTFLFY